jgi:hypothetical protein
MLGVPPYSVAETLQQLNEGDDLDDLVTKFEGVFQTWSDVPL